VGEAVGRVVVIVVRGVTAPVPAGKLGVRNEYGSGLTRVRARAPGVKVGSGVCVGVFSAVATKTKDPSTLKIR
jgi:hypothetical protein